MQKIVQNGCRTATVTLDGSECEVIFGSRYSVFSAASENDVIIALESGKQQGDDGVMVCKGGESVMYPHMMSLNKVYLTGSGTVKIFASNCAVNPFKTAGKGGDGGIKRGVISLSGVYGKYTTGTAVENEEEI